MFALLNTPLSTYIYKCKKAFNSVTLLNLPFSFFFLQGKMDRTLALLQNADPADPAPDSLELLQLEGINLNAGVNSTALQVTAAVGLSYSVVF